MQAQHLRIQLAVNGAPRVDLTFEARLVAKLRDLVPPHLTPKLEAQGVDLDAMARDAVARDFAPGELFRLPDGDRLIRVWLE